MSERTGGCLCGRVRYTLSAEPVAARICWCRCCQRIAGNGTANAIVPSAALTVTGDTAAYTSPAESGNQVTRRFCPHCGSHLFADSTGRPGLTALRVGTLDEPSAIKPGGNIWTSSAPSWACLDDSIPNVERQPAPAQARPG